MQASSRPMPSAAAFEIRFEPLRQGGTAMAFPCDSAGQVDLDTMSERMRNDYFFARGMIGREYAMPQVAPRALH